MPLKPSNQPTNQTSFVPTSPEFLMNSVPSLTFHISSSQLMFPYFSVTFSINFSNFNNIPLRFAPLLLYKLFCPLSLKIPLEFCPSFWLYKFLLPNYCAHISSAPTSFNFPSSNNLPLRCVPCFAFQTYFAPPTTKFCINFVPFLTFHISYDQMLSPQFFCHKFH